MTIKAPNSESENDQIAWFPKADGIFTLKMAYQSLIDSDISAWKRLYKYMWKVKAPPKVERFNIVGNEQSSPNEWGSTQKRFVLI